MAGNHYENEDRERLIRIEERLAILIKTQADFALNFQADLKNLSEIVNRDYVTKTECALKQATRQESGYAKAVQVSKIATLMAIASSVIFAVIKHA